MMILTLLIGQAIAEPPKFDMVGGFRMGYGYVANSELRSPHVMVLGWDQMYSLDTNTSLDVIVAGNISVGGVNQGEILPSAHLIIGYQIWDSLQFGVGPVVTFSEFDPVVKSRLNMITAMGWNIEMGDFYIPLHAAYVPDVDGRWRAYLTTGMNWPLGKNDSME